MIALLFRRLPVLVLMTGFLTGCASARDPRDPWEPVNRVTFEVNETLDRTIIKHKEKALSHRHDGDALKHQAK